MQVEGFLGLAGIENANAGIMELVLLRNGTQ